MTSSRALLCLLGALVVPGGRPLTPPPAVPMMAASSEGGLTLSPRRTMPLVNSVVDRVRQNAKAEDALQMVSVTSLTRSLAHALTTSHLAHMCAT